MAILRLDMTIIALLTLLQILLTGWQIEGPTRIAGGLLLLSVWPGYCVLAALESRFRRRLSAPEHVALAIPTSLGLHALLGLALNALGGRAWSWLYSAGTGGCVILLALATAVRGRRSDAGPTLSRALAIAGIGLVALTAGTVIDHRTAPRSASHLSLYLLDEAGQMSAYPTRVTPGEQVRVHVGITYDGPIPRALRLIRSRATTPVGAGGPTRSALDAGRTEAVTQITLQPHSEWEQPATLRLEQAGLHRITWRLCPAEGGRCERSVHLWIQAEGSAEEPARARARGPARAGGRSASVTGGALDVDELQGAE